MTYGGLHIGIATKIPPAKAGYFAGGNNGSTILSTIDKITYSTDTRTTLTSRLSQVGYDGVGFENSGTAGYFTATASAFGSNNSVTTSISKIVFGVDSISVLSNTLSTQRLQTTAVSNSGTAGYIGGGFYAISDIVGSPISSVDKVNFSSDSVSTLSMGFDSWVGPQSMSNNAVAGYSIGNWLRDNSDFNEIIKLNFSNDTVSSLSTLFQVSRQLNAAASNSGNAGYLAGGQYNGTNISSIEKLSFSSESSSLLTINLSSTIYDISGASNSGTAGYFSGGFSGTTVVSSIQKILFSNDSISTLGINLSAKRTAHSSASNSGVL